MTVGGLLGCLGAFIAPLVMCHPLAQLFNAKPWEMLLILYGVVYIVGMFVGDDGGGASWGDYGT